VLLLMLPLIGIREPCRSDALLLLPNRCKPDFRWLRLTIINASLAFDLFSNSCSACSVWFPLSFVSMHSCRPHRSEQQLENRVRTISESIGLDTLWTV